MPTSAAKRLAADGTVIDGADGEPRTIRFDFAALARAEEHPGLGSIDGCVAALKRIVDSRGNGFDVPIMGDLRALLTASMQPCTSDDVLDELAPQRIGDVIDAVLDAWLEAWPAKSDVDEGKATAPTTAESSRGRSSTTRRRSPSDATTPPSGG